MLDELSPAWTNHLKQGLYRFSNDDSSVGDTPKSLYQDTTFAQEQYPDLLSSYMASLDALILTYSTQCCLRKALVVECGTGHDAVTLSQYGFEVYALSRSNTVLSSAVEYAVSVAENKCYNLKSPSGSAGETHFLRGEFGNSEWQESLPDPEDKFDLIYSSTTVWTSSHPFADSWLGRVQQVLKPGGLVLCCEDASDMSNGWHVGEAQDYVKLRNDTKTEITFDECPAKKSILQKNGQKDSLQFVQYWERLRSYEDDGPKRAISTLFVICNDMAAVEVTQTRDQFGSRSRPGFPYDGRPFPSSTF